MIPRMSLKEGLGQCQELGSQLGPEQMRNYERISYRAGVCGLWSGLLLLGLRPKPVAAKRRHHPWGSKERREQRKASQEQTLQGISAPGPQADLEKPMPTGKA